MMQILPLPQFEADLKQHLQEEDRKTYEAMLPPKTVVARFGAMKMIGEFPYDGKAKPGCGSKLIVRTFRGTELGEMLTSTCPNSGCGKSVSRQDMLKYVENSGGKDYPFFTDGRVVRIATSEDINLQAKLEQSKHELNVRARSVVERLGMTVKIVEMEPIIGGERMTGYYLSEQRLDLRDLARELSHEFHTRVEMRQVGARDEARLTADFEKCGQYCCCKNFLKVLKPISMKAAKTQKATLEPLKISGRCGRLMCCLRYEEQTYDDLKARLPRRKSRVGTPEGDGTVVDGQILTQLVLVLLDEPDATGQIKQMAVAVEDLSEPKSAHAPVPKMDLFRGPPAPASRGDGRRSPAPTERREGAGAPGSAPPTRPSTDRRPDAPRPARPPQTGAVPQARPKPAPPVPPAPKVSTDLPDDADDVVFDENGNEIKGTSGPASAPGEPASGTSERDEGRRRRRRRRRGRGPGGQGGSPASGAGGGGGGGAGGGG
jgi:cell fate regulator YaaT (PSP1 superfamily)